MLTGDQIDIRRHGHLETQAFGEHLRFQVGAIRAIDMGQRAAVMILAFFAGHQPDSPVTRRHQCFKAFACGHGEGFVGTALLAQLRRVQADHAHIAAIAQTQGVAIHHPLHRDGRQAAWCRTNGLRARQPNRGHKKGAREGRLFHQHGKTAAASQVDRP
ncbi:hypothetical protein D3C75_887050 [compost metagenome]